MSNKTIIQINDQLRLRRPTQEEWAVAIDWYKDPEVLYMSEGSSQSPYDLEVIHRMYTYLNEIGRLYFIEARENDIWQPIGDVTYSEVDMPIVIGDSKFRSKGIGKKVIGQLIRCAREEGIKSLHVKEIYHYNKASQHCFMSQGFVLDQTGEKGSSYRLDL